MEQATFANNAIKLSNSDYFTAYRKIEPGSINLILADIPYGVLTEKCDWDIDVDLTRLEMTFDHVLHPKGQIIMFCNLALLVKLLNSFTKFTYYTHYIWKKPSPMPLSKYFPLGDSEFILVFRRTDTKVSDLTFNPTEANSGIPYQRKNTQTDVKTRRMVKSPMTENKTGDRWIRTILSAPNKPCMPAAEKTSHPSQKPISLGRVLLKTHSNTGDNVLDPFAGSGSFLLSCFYEGRKCQGFEMNKPYFNEASQRLGLFTNQINLFQTVNTESTLKQEILL